MVAPRLVRRLRGVGPEIVLLLVAIVAGVSVWQAWAVVVHLREQARQTSRIYAEVTAALADATPGVDTETLLALVAQIRGSGMPLVVIDPGGRPAATANVPFDAHADSVALAQYLAELGRDHPPITVPGVGVLHFGTVPAARRLTFLTYLQLALLATLIAVGFWAYRVAAARDRDRLWVAMARESAHQLGTPLMSAGAWVDRLADGASAPPEIARHLKADLERLGRVAQRFERIGRPARRDHVAVGALAERVAAYFRPRLPRHAHAVVLTVVAPDAGPTVVADAALLEWALEALVRNSLDALSGRGGAIEMSVAEAGDRVLVRVTDDGPGIRPEVRSRLFEPGISTKPGGWGIGLALARRIVEDVHGGRLELAPAAHGAVFVARLPKGDPDRERA